MSKLQQAEFTNMCMICDGTRVLAQDRVNLGWPGVTFPDGHVEMGESFVDSVIRELKEQTGLDIANVRLCGIKQFVPKAGEEKYDRYIVLLYQTDTFSGELKSSEEGRVFWIECENLKNYNLPHGFDSMVTIFEKEELSENYWGYRNVELYMENK